MSDNAWSDLSRAIEMLAFAATGDRPLHCEHDELTVMSDPDYFTTEQLAELEELGFFPDDDGCFKSFRFGSA